MHLSLQMFRGPQVMTRPLLLGVRDPHRPAFCVHTGANGCLDGRAQNKWRNVRIIGRGRREAGPSLSKKTKSSSSLLSLLSSDPGQDSSQNLKSKGLSWGHHQVSASINTKLGEHLAENPKALSTYHDCLVNTTTTSTTAGLQPQRRCWDFDQLSHSVINRTKCNLLQSRSLYRSHFIRPFSSLTQTLCVLTRWHSRVPPCCCSFHQTRAFQAAPCDAAVLRGCLSLENEERCRHSLGPNLKLYEVDKGKRGAGQSQGRWASVLVSLCSVDGEPAFLFTLRSSTLKGRHKGDVRLVLGWVYILTYNFNDSLREI